MYLYSSVVSVTSGSSTLDAMTLMSDEGVSSVAVIDEEQGRLLSALSVTDIGKVTFPQEDARNMISFNLRLSFHQRMLRSSRHLFTVLSLESR